MKLHIAVYKSLSLHPDWDRSSDCCFPLFSTLCPDRMLSLNSL